jgi:hypothetical protein
MPNGEQHEVGSGSWNWQADYQDPDERGPLTVDDLTGEIMNDKRAGNAIIAALKRAEVPKFQQEMILGEHNITLRQSLRILSRYEDTVRMMDDALADLM